MAPSRMRWNTFWEAAWPRNNWTKMLEMLGTLNGDIGTGLQNTQGYQGRLMATIKDGSSFAQSSPLIDDQTVWPYGYLVIRMQLERYAGWNHTGMTWQLMMVINYIGEHTHYIHPQQTVAPWKKQIGGRSSSPTMRMCIWLNMSLCTTRSAITSGRRLQLAQLNMAKLYMHLVSSLRQTSLTWSICYPCALNNSGVRYLWMELLPHN